MLELLRWEVNEVNAVTKRSAMNREVQTLPLTSMYGNQFKDNDIDFVAISALLIAGIYYLNLHRKCSPFCGIDISTEDGRGRLMNAIEVLSGKMFKDGNTLQKRYNDKITAIADKMKQRGFSKEDIFFVLSD